MRLNPNWFLILRKAWSVKFNIAATLLGAAEVAVALLEPFDIPNGLFAGGAALVSIGANIARLMAQKEIT